MVRVISSGSRLLSLGVGLLVGLSACAPTTSQPTGDSPSTTETPSEPSSPSVEATSPSSPETPDVVMEDHQISEEGLGVARLGMTLGELKQQMGEGVEFETQAPFIVDFDAIAVRRSGELLFHILYLAGQPFTDDDVIQGLMTDNAIFQTAEGVGPGTLISEAETQYGKATLAYNTDNEGREYVRFAQQPATNISFATGNSNTETAGVYDASATSYNETQTYREGAKIQSVLIVCLSESCAKTGE